MLGMRKNNRSELSSSWIKWKKGMVIIDEFSVTES